MGEISFQAFWVVILVGGVVLALFVGAIVWFMIARRQRKRREQLTAKTQPSSTQAQPVASLSANGVEEGFGLQFIDESGSVKTFTTLPISIGRSAQNDLVLDDETVSSQHASIYYDEVVGAVCILNLDSPGGIRIDGHPTRKNILQNGVKVRLGDAQLEFRDTGYIHPDPL